MAAESGVGEVEVGTVGEGEPVGDVSAILAYFLGVCVYVCRAVWCGWVWVWMFRERWRCKE